MILVGVLFSSFKITRVGGKWAEWERCKGLRWVLWSALCAMWGVRWDQAQGREADLPLPCLALPSSLPFEPGKVWGTGMGRDGMDLGSCVGIAFFERAHRQWHQSLWPTNEERKGTVAPWLWERERHGHRPLPSPTISSITVIASKAVPVCTTQTADQWLSEEPLRVAVWK